MKIQSAMKRCKGRSKGPFRACVKRLMCKGKIKAARKCKPRCRFGRNKRTGHCLKHKRS